MVWAAILGGVCLMAGYDLPVAKESGLLVGPLRMPNASPEAFGADVARATIGVGEQFSALGNTLATRGRERKDRTEKYAAQTGLMQLEAGYAKKEQDGEVDPNLPADPVGYSTTFLSDLDAAGEQVLSGVPEKLRPEVKTKLLAIRSRFELSTSKFESERRTGFRKTQLVEGMDTAAGRLAVDPSQWRQTDDDIIAQAHNSGLTKPDQDLFIKAWKERRALTVAAIQDKADPEKFRPRVAPEVAGGDGVVSPEAVIMKEEGELLLKPKWDVDHWRVGYSSDTITRADGSVESVKEDSVITADDAERDLHRRVRVAANTASADIGSIAWGRLDDATHAAISSVIYHYGHLPSSLVDPLRSGDKEAIAVAVESLSSNPDRREREAAIIRSGKGPEGTHGVAPEFQDLPIEKRLTLYDQSVTDQAAKENAVRSADNRQAAATKGSYELQISTDPEHTDMRAMLADPTLKDMDKAALFNSWKMATGNTNAVRADTALYARGGLQLNPFDESDRGRANKVFEQLTKGATDPNELKATTADFIRKTGIVPTKVAADLRLGLASTNPQNLATSLVDATNLYDRSKTAIDAMDGGSSIRDQVAEFKTLINGRGMSPAEAAQNILMRRGSEWKVTAEALKAAGDTFVKTLTVADITAQLDPGIMTAEPGAVTPAVAAEMLVDYQAIAREKLVLSRGDADIAKAQAQAEVLTLYNVSNAGGRPVVMKYPPEKYYPPVEGSYDYLQKSVKQAALMGATGLDPTRVGDADAAGLVKPGTVDLFGEAARPAGPLATVRKVEGGYAILPTFAVDGTKQTAEAAVAEFGKSGRSLGVFDSEENAIAYAQSVSAGLPSYSNPKVKIGEIELQPYQDTTDDLRAGRPPRYILHYQEERDGQMIWQTVLDHAWQATPSEMHVAGATAEAGREEKMKEQTRIVEEMRKQVDAGAGGIRQELMGGQ